jgi:hypothetical protein
MSSLTVVSAALLSIAALSGCAQDNFVRQGGPGDCATDARRTLHDHGIERGYGPMSVKACNKTTVADAGNKAASATVE